MTNKDIANAFQRLARIMELLGENSFKIKSYQNAYVLLRKWPDDLGKLGLEELEAIPGVGKAIAAKIRELEDTGELSTYRKYADQVPPGVIEMLEIPGVGPKKVSVIWKELGVEGPGELLYACQENRLSCLHGFGEKTQRDIQEKLEFYIRSKDRWTGASARRIAANLCTRLEGMVPGSSALPTGEVRRWCPVVDSIEVLWIIPDHVAPPQQDGFHYESERRIQYQEEDGPSLTIHLASPGDAGRRLWETTGSSAYMQRYERQSGLEDAAEEKAWLDRHGLPYHFPEWRDDADRAESYAERSGANWEMREIRGVIHAHSTWSDGVNTLLEMAEACRSAGYEYLVITDHSQAAFYAQGLSPERVLAQHREIEALNAQLHPFRIFKGIEADILHDGSLDYTPDILELFEVVIASVHSNLRMTEDKAMSRLLAAVEHPRTHILGHPTGRLLLGRSGYPVDHRRLIDACAANGVAIELNANPLRLDLDWEWIPYAMEKQVRIAINPDAHSIAGIRDIEFGYHTAMKGGLTRSSCLNVLTASDFEAWVTKRR